MKTIFIISGDHGDYSDRQEWNVVATKNEDTAIRLVDQLNELSRLMEVFLHRKFEFRLDWEKTHPSPGAETPISEEFRKREKLCRSGCATQKDKEEFKKLQAEHIQNREQHKLVLRDWNKASQKAQDDYCAEANQVPEYLKQTYDLERGQIKIDTSYGYSELQVIE